MIRNILFVIVFLTSIYVCICIVIWPEVIVAKSRYSELVNILRITSPWLLLIISFKSWYRAFTWRRMIKAQQSFSLLPRGQTINNTPKPRIGFLEKFCMLLLLLALCAIWTSFK